MSNDSTASHTHPQPTILSSHDQPFGDAEKASEAVPGTQHGPGHANIADNDQGPTSTPKSSWKQRIQRFLQQRMLEPNAITRIPPTSRHSTSHLGLTQTIILWFSINLAANNTTLGMLGPTVFSLPFLDASLCAVLGMLVGSLPVAYVATFGPRAGIRTMVLSRYVMGMWPTKIVIVLTLVILLGYSLIDVVIAGQILSAVSVGNDLSIVVGIVITGLLSWLITTFGYTVFHHYERYAWLPQLTVNMILAGVAGPRFNLSSNIAAELDTRTLIGNRLSFFSLCLAAAITYSCAAADYFVYYPETTPRTRMFAATMIGLTTSFTPMFIIGIGLGSGLTTNRSWEDAYSTSQGALIVSAFRPLGTFGSFCSVIIALGLISNLVAPTYASGVDWQALGRHFHLIPRPVWNTLSVLIYTIAAIAGRASLATIFTNFLALMGYWVCVWTALLLCEHCLFRYRLGMGWNWDAWDDRTKLPDGWAGMAAFLVGWVGAILGMAQVWYIGPVAGLIGDYGGDVGSYLGFVMAAIVYCPLRWLELKRCGR